MIKEKEFNIICPIPELLSQQKAFDVGQVINDYYHNRN